MLKYLGGGFIRGVPARNLTDDEVKKYGKARLLKSGLYKEVKHKPAQKAVEKEN
jgi:hypothetical protein